MLIPETWNEDWDNFMNDPENIKLLKEIEPKLGDNYFPRKDKVLRMLQMSLKDKKGVAMGMEPYPSSFIKNGIEIPEATGRSFEVASLEDWTKPFKQTSLQNIIKTIYFNEYGKKVTMKALRQEIKNGTFPIKPPKEFFNSLEAQGILLLNATLTVKANQVDSHTAIWEEFMTRVIKYIVSVNPDLKWFLWGTKAQNRVAGLIPEESALCTNHPRLSSFIEQNCFKEIKEINWLG